MHRIDGQGATEDHKFTEGNPTSYRQAHGWSVWEAHQ